ncbi:MAG: hypothetical protein KatS3mg131_2343 [Candidatus Tectimicrobiota bacterium]|nr:MAG: hypothetical protein KatS3mg131_2343 [Candidatus Tectomicrobia bacterium]
MPVEITDIVQIVEAQERWRGQQTINLIASENAPSPAVRAIQNSDFMGRYAEGHPNRGDQINRYYQGTRYIDQIETMAREELMALARCRQADVRPISGNAANTAIALGYLRAGDPIIVNSTAAGGHISHNTIGVFGRRLQMRGMSLNLDAPNHIPLYYFPLTEDLYHLDVPKTLELIERVSPRLLVLGKSLFLFPEPVRELAAVCRERDIPILYDGAHVFGLILGGFFQDPLREGATWMTASTHKTFPGPQRGVILADLDPEEERKYWPPADRGVFPGSSSNHHLHTPAGAAGGHPRNAKARPGLRLANRAQRQSAGPRPRRRGHRGGGPGTLATPRATRSPSMLPPTAVAWRWRSAWKPTTSSSTTTCCPSTPTRAILPACASACRR